MFVLVKHPFKHYKNRRWSDYADAQAGLHLYDLDLEKTCLWGFVNNTGADQPANPRRLISAFFIHLVESFIYKLASSEISIV